LNPFLCAQTRGVLRRVSVDVDARDIRSLARAQYRDGAPVTDRCIGVFRGPCAGTDDHDAAAGEPTTARRNAE
jgi:hypothetical protein